jgi:hypothetical protein
MTIDLTNPAIYVILVCLLSGIFGFLGFFLGLKALIDVKALQKSTHSVQYMPIDPKIDEENQSYLEENWATSDDALNEQHKMYQEDIEENMPSFLPEDKDKKRYSF